MSEYFKHPAIDAFIGETKKLDSQSQRISHQLDDLMNRGSKHIADFEIEKSSRDQEIIDVVMREIDAILEKYGRTIPSVNLTNIHILKPDGISQYTDGMFRSGAYAPLLRSVLVDRCSSDVEFAAALFHELLHLKSYTAFQLVTNPRNSYDGLGEYRSGFKVVSRDGGQFHFQAFEEAVVSYLELQFVQEILSKHPLFKEKYAKELETYEFSRTTDRKRLVELVDDLYNKNKDKFTSTQEVTDVFIRAQINGDLLPIARLVESTYGKGSFRKLGEITPSD